MRTLPYQADNVGSHNLHLPFNKFAVLWAEMSFPAICGDFELVQSKLI